MTTIQDYPARTGYWDIGVPPSGPFDFYSFKLANRLLNNPADAAGLEITLQGPSLKFYQDCQVAITGAPIELWLDEKAQQCNQIINIKAGQVLKTGNVTQAGARAYLAFSGGIQCPDYLGSKSTFTLGQFGGHCGRALRMGDFLSLPTFIQAQPLASLNEHVVTPVTNDWTLRVMYGPHGAPDFFTKDDIKTIHAHQWKIHYNSSRTGIRLIGPKPDWARETGGEAGLHPSNIHDNAYAFGTVDFTGDMPVILGPDGPSLGGFVCPFTVISADLWKLGQLKAGDSLRFEVVDNINAQLIETAQNSQLASLERVECNYQTCEPSSPIIDTLVTDDGEPDLVFRQAGDKFLLAEYGELILDLNLRARVQALLEALQNVQLNGVLELTPGIRSLQIHYDNQSIEVQSLVNTIKQLDLNLGDTRQLSFESRVVHLPLSWNDKACQEAIDKYHQSVRKDAPWCPSNLEFIKRINGLNSIEEVKNIVFNANYLVLGLGDVYLGAPVATPLDHCHRLVTTKYNPARTWTAENSVGIGGAYMCIYGMEGPGGYQFVGRTVQMWNRYRKTDVFNKPWLLRFFDQIKYYPVSHEELMQTREDFVLGKWQPKIEQAVVSMPELQKQWQQNQKNINTFTQQREQAFAEEMEQWKRTGQLNYKFEESETEQGEQIKLAPGQYLMEATAAGSVWKINAEQNQAVDANESMVILESMKMEIDLTTSESAKVVQVLVKEGQQVHAGQALMILQG